MKGLELAEKYYETYGRQMLEERFPQVIGRAAMGLVGQGSECFGFDDEISTTMITFFLYLASEGNL